MCDTNDRAGIIAVEALPASLEWKGEVLPLEPVDELSALTVCDKATHAIARRLPGAFIQNSVGTTFHLTAAAA